MNNWLFQLLKIYFRIDDLISSVDEICQELRHESIKINEMEIDEQKKHLKIIKNRILSHIGSMEVSGFMDFLI